MILPLITVPHFLLRSYLPFYPAELLLYTSHSVLSITCLSSSNPSSYLSGKTSMLAAKGAWEIHVIMLTSTSYIYNYIVTTPPAVWFHSLSYSSYFLSHSQAPQTTFHFTKKRHQKRITTNSCQSACVCPTLLPVKMHSFVVSQERKFKAYTHGRFYWGDGR